MKTYLALGDSYTIGEGTLPEERFPNQLVSKINMDANIQLFDTPRIVATTGWTTDELLAAIKDTTLDNKYDLVSLLIGVNNQYRNYPLAQFEAEFKQLIDIAIDKCRMGAARVFVLTIPDWGNTNFATTHESHTALSITKDIDVYNDLIKNICKPLNIPVIDITTFTRANNVKGEYLVDDGLHYNKEQHALWVNKIILEIPNYFMH